jgi:NAD(P)-dependent dehydrogenase (short-subunit alcohol dehydrogenase family)
MSGRLSGTRALVTGAASGIGRAIADQFGIKGATVAALDQDEAALSIVLENLHAGGADALAIRADVRSETEVREAIGDAIRALGGLDILVANAGVQLFGADAPVHELTLASWQETIDINLTGAFLTCKCGLRPMVEQGRAPSYASAPRPDCAEPQRDFTRTHPARRACLGWLG